MSEKNRTQTDTKVTTVTEVLAGFLLALEKDDRQGAEVLLEVVSEYLKDGAPINVKGAISRALAQM